MRIQITVTVFLLAVAVAAVVASTVPTTINDFKLPGSQPMQSGTIETSTSCTNCHGGYAAAVEPGFNWKGSMMAHAARDPLFYAALAIANQDAAGSGDLCIRCHTPKGWLEGRSVPPDGSALTAADRDGVTCAFCHNLVKPTPLGVNPYPADSLYTATTYELDQQYLMTLLDIPPAAGSGMYVVDANDTRRGPYSDIASPQHLMGYSPFHRDAALCGTCHDVSNPALSRDSTGVYVLNGNDSAAPSFDPSTHFPVERTYSEWRMSAYNSPAGVFAPQFGGNKTNVSSCQDCHMRDVTGKGCNRPISPVRNDLPLHDLTGGNTFALKLVAALYPTEVDTAAIAAGIERARFMLQNAASLDLELSPLWSGWRARVRITNETGHKLPTGYVEGRRMWIWLRAFTAGDSLIYESGAYDSATAVLAHDPDIKVYECDLGISPAMATATGLAAGPSFHFVLNDMIYKDNRIPPRGFTNANFAAVQAAPVGTTYTDGQYWDDTFYNLPPETHHVTVVLRYQTSSKEYIEFLRNQNTTNSAGEVLYNAWAANGKSFPETMRAVTDTVPAVTSAAPPAARELPALAVQALPRGGTRFALDLPRAGHVKLHVFDAAARRVAVLADADLPAGRHELTWSARGRPSGIYFARLETSAGAVSRKVLVVR
jgi:hypothetical protein